MYDKTYTSPTVTVDGVIVQVVDSKLAVLLVKRAHQPYAGQWALPGGYCPAGETTAQALDRIVTKKAGVSTSTLPFLEQVYTFDALARDPRDHAVSITYLGLSIGMIAGGPDTWQPRFFALDSLPPLAYDHQKIIAHALEWLRAKLSDTNIAYALLPPTFTLTQLQSVYEAVLDKPLDRRNFRKKFLTLDLVAETGDMKKEGAHRPARLYAFNQTSLQKIVRSFD